ncbi:glycosyltransferase family 1 protein [Ruoffia tabacinasalis]|uniref:glycosyltransferase family 1 protein n=1 Tax=Ruoffia tabacinasalis TaxID=87458 RepID=UPI0030D3C966
MTKPIKVLQVLATLNRGGAESMIMNIYRNIDRSKVQFDFVVNESEEEYAFEEEVKSLGGKIYTIPKFNYSNLPSYSQKWRTLFENHSEWKIIHAHHTTPAFIYLKIAQEYGMKTISHSHTAGMEKNPKAKLKKILRYPLRYESDLLVSCSDKAAEWMFGKKGKETKILYNAIETEKYVYNDDIRKSIRNKLSLNNKVVIGHVGRFDLEKNHDFLIDIFFEYHKINPESKLLLVGVGKLEEKIKEKVDEYNISDNVLFLGARSDVNDLLQSMDIFIMPSLFEGLPVTLIEAQASGLPILASDTITKEVEITNLVKFKDIKSDTIEWAKEINNLINMPRTNRYNEIVEAGYDVAQSSRELENIYINL